MHASSTLPAFVLSQNQTLRIIENQISRIPLRGRSTVVSGFFEFPSTNLLCCRASPPASRSRPEGRPRRAGALPDKSGSVVKDHPRRRRVPPPRCRVPSGSSEPSLRPARLKRVRCKLSNPGPPRQPLFRSFFKKVFRAGFARGFAWSRQRQLARSRSRSHTRAPAEPTKLEDTSAPPRMRVRSLAVPGVLRKHACKAWERGASAPPHMRGGSLAVPGPLPQARMHSLGARSFRSAPDASAEPRGPRAGPGWTSLTFENHEFSENEIRISDPLPSARRPRSRAS